MKTWGFAIFLRISTLPPFFQRKFPETQESALEKGRQREEGLALEKGVGNAGVRKNIANPDALGFFPTQKL